ncbi:MAG: hypothetical protein DHS20C11_24030 [Lysobacteraceae bacterium]|nr:MAG: hypothetical protein DHS20C11_24030 [Xanthomonadaceae bacterium]
MQKLPAHKQLGFTLLEMMLAMTLVALIMAMAFTGLRSGAKAADKGEAYVDRTNRMRLAQQFMRQQMSRVLPLRIQDDPDDATDYIIFQGSRDLMRFVAPMPGYLGHGGPHVQLFEVDGDKLLFNHYLLNAEDGLAILADPDRDPVLLLDKIDRAKFSYATLNEDGELSDWVDEWEDATVTPLAIQVEIDFQSDAKMTFPTMQVALMIDGAAAHAPGITDFSRPSDRQTDRNRKGEGER